MKRRTFFSWVFGCICGWFTHSFLSIWAESGGDVPRGTSRLAWIADPCYDDAYIISEEMWREYFKACREQERVQAIVDRYLLYGRDHDKVIEEMAAVMEVSDGAPRISAVAGDSERRDLWADLLDPEGG